jgi:hypothetical protein
MKFSYNRCQTFLFILSLSAISGFSQEKKVDIKIDKSEKSTNNNLSIEFKHPEQEALAKKDGFDSALVALKVAQSKKDLEAKFGIEQVKLMSPISVTYELIDDKKSDECDCDQPKLITNSDLDQEIKDLESIMNNSHKFGKKGVLFIHWGYNRGYHSRSDITVKTDKGSYTIKNARGTDRVSNFKFSEYFKASNFSVPQYNLKIGYWFSRDSKFGIGIGTDHMKWVFDPNQKYEIEGDYTGDLWVKGQKKSFDEIVKGQDASFLLLEHTDGYNYPYIEGLYREKLVNSRRFEIDAIAGVGAGVLFPKTRTRVADQENTSEYRDIDNQFHVAGFAFHADASLAFKYKKKNGVSFFLKPTVRGVAGKINNALYFAEEGEISQSTIYTLEPSLSLGVEVPLNAINNPKKRETRRKLRALRKIKKLEDEKQKEKTLVQLQEEFDAAKAKKLEQEDETTISKK